MAPRRSATPPNPAARPAGVVRAIDTDRPPLLLRIPVNSPTWAESLPPLPDGARVTVSFSDAEVEAEHGDALALLGYESVGVRSDTPTEPPTVDLLIPRGESDRWPLWRDQLLNAGGRVWDLAFGPVAALLGPAVAVHQRPAHR